MYDPPRSTTPTAARTKAAQLAIEAAQTADAQRGTRGRDERGVRRGARRFVMDVRVTTRIGFALAIAGLAMLFIAPLAFAAPLMAFALGWNVCNLLNS